MTVRIEISVDGITRRTFIAARVGRASDAKEEIDLEVNATYPYAWAEYVGSADDRSLSRGSRVDGMARHRYGDGLEALAAKILAAYIEVNGVDHHILPEAKRDLKCPKCWDLIPEGEDHICNAAPGV